MLNGGFGLEIIDYLIIFSVSTANFELVKFRVFNAVREVNDHSDHEPTSCVGFGDWTQSKKDDQRDQKRNGWLERIERNFKAGVG